MKSFLLFFVVSSIVYTAIGQDEIAYAPIPIDRNSDKICGYNSLSNLLQDEGEKIGNPNGYNIGLDKCKQKCTDTYACKSFTWCSIGFTKCHMKGKIVNVDRYEPTKNDPNCKTYYPKDCIFGDCKCGNSCRMGNGRIGVCQEDNETCAQNINQPFCPEDRRNCKLAGESCGPSATGRNNGECCYEGGFQCLASWRLAPGAESSCRRCEDDSFWKDGKHGDGKARCVDLTLDYCNNRERYGDDYTEEARKNCPKSCGLC